MPTGTHDFDWVLQLLIKFASFIKFIMLNKAQCLSGPEGRKGFEGRLVLLSSPIIFEQTKTRSQNQLVLPTKNKKHNLLPTYSTAYEDALFWFCMSMHFPLISTIITQDDYVVYVQVLFSNMFQRFVSIFISNFYGQLGLFS